MRSVLKGFYFMGWAVGVVLLFLPDTQAASKTNPMLNPADTPHIDQRTPFRVAVKSVRLEQKEGWKIVVLSEGRLTPEIFQLDQNRLVIDLPGAKAMMPLKSVVIQDPAIKQLRMGQHPDKLRLVLDLASPVEYSVAQKGKRLIVSLKSVSPVEAKVTSPSSPPSSSAGRISLDFVDAEVGEVIGLIADVSGLKLEMGEKVRGKVTLNLSNVSWEEALRTVLATRQLTYRREGQVIRVVERQEGEGPSGSVSEVSPTGGLVTRVYPIKSAEVHEVLGAVQNLLTSQGSAVGDTTNRTLTVTDVEGKMAEMAQMIKSLDIYIPRVVIETRMVQATSRFKKRLGIQWEARQETIPGLQEMSSQNFKINLPGDPRLGESGMVLGRLTGQASDLDKKISDAESDGSAHLMGSPRVTVLNDQEAVIRVAGGGGGPEASPDGPLFTLLMTPKGVFDGETHVKLKVVGRTAVPWEIAQPIQVRAGQMMVVGLIPEASSRQEEGDRLSEHFVFLIFHTLK